MKFNYIIVCHSGAGNHSVSRENLYKNVCKRACKASHAILEDNSNSIPDIIRAAVEAVKVLEDDPCTNAGLGSNLTISGKLQCDASIMCGQSLRFGAVGCLSNIKNPILVAEKLLSLQLQNSLSNDGRYPPSMLVGSDATEWAISHEIKSVQDEELITVNRMRKYEKFKTITQNSSSLKRQLNCEDIKTVVKKQKVLSEIICDKKVEKDNIKEKQPVRNLLNKDENLLDTVGVIIADSLGRVVSATSSGGILLKQDGRLGQSCMFGCGCYSEQKDNGISVTAVSTGLGEQLMRTMLPMKTCDAVSSWNINEDGNLNDKFQLFLDKNFMNSPFVIGDVYKSFGILCLRREIMDDNRVSIDLLFGHSTPSLCLAYLSSGDGVACEIMSRKNDNSEFVVGSTGTIFQL